MFALPNLNRTGSPVSCITRQTLKRDAMEGQDHRYAQTKRAFVALDSVDHAHHHIYLPNGVFGFANGACLLIKDERRFVGLAVTLIVHSDFAIRCAASSTIALVIRSFSMCALP